MNKFAAHGSMLPFGGCAPPSHYTCSAVDDLLARRAGSGSGSGSGSATEIGGLNKPLRPTPAHLSRALYIPHHGDRTVHLPVYEFSEAYRRSVGDTPLGGSEYRTRLCLLRKPTVSSVNAEVRYLINMTGLDGGARVDERCLGEGQEAEVHPHHGDSFSLRTTAPSRGPEYRVTASYPLPPTVSHGKRSLHPYFALSAVSDDEKEEEKEEALPALEWQTHPGERGALCYVLVDRAAQLASDDEADYVRAIYHHAGLESTLPRAYSEGFLLLPGARGCGAEQKPGQKPEQDPARDILLISSVRGMLRIVRGQAERPLAAARGSASVLGSLTRAITRPLRAAAGRT